MSETLPLAADFPATTDADWLAAVRGVVLKGRPDATDDEFAAAFARQLVHHTADGIEIQPLYGLSSPGEPKPGPGEAPYTRGTAADPAPWEVRQRVFAGVAGSSALTELESGATGLLIELPAGDAGPVLDGALDGVHVEMAPVSLATWSDDDGAGAATALVDLWESRGTATGARAGTLGVDPLGTWARSGGSTDLDAGLRAAAALLERIADHPAAVRLLVADGTVWHEAGATPAQELAWAIAAGVQYVRDLGDAAGPRIEFRWAADADQFTGIAKLRAARQLWARVADGAVSYHHVEGSRAMLTRYDTWTNTLRSTVACFAAGVGGADAVTIWPHDSLVTAGGSALGRRVARNTQTILQSESHLWRVLDPAGGSWYVETLTDQLAAAAWTELARIDAFGGLRAAIAAGEVHRALDGVLTARTRLLTTRKQSLTGLSEFPDIGEEPPPPPDPPAPAATPFARFGLVRLSEGFEAQRARADQHWRSTGRRPTVHLATLGTPAQFTARATFAKNLFEAGGIRTVAGPVSDFTGGVACLCSSDAQYAEQGAEAADQLRRAGATYVYAAGRQLGLPGVDEEIGMGVDVLDVLTRALDHLLDTQPSSQGAPS